MLWMAVKKVSCLGSLNEGKETECDTMAKSTTRKRVPKRITGYGV